MEFIFWEGKLAGGNLKEGKFGHEGNRLLYGWKWTERNSFQKGGGGK